MFALYSTIYPYMDENNYMSFEDFYSPKVVEVKTKEEDLQDIKRILDTFNGGEND